MPFICDLPVSDYIKFAFAATGYMFYLCNYCQAAWAGAVDKCSVGQGCDLLQEEKYILQLKLRSKKDCVCEKFTSWIDDSEVISKNTASWRPRPKGTILQCPTVVIIAAANVVLNLLIYPFTCATVISILMSIIKTEVGIIALHTSFLWSTTEVSDNLQRI